MHFLTRLAVTTLMTAPLATITATAAPTQSHNGTQNLEKIGHIIVIYEENRSFDNLYGRFPGANGLSKAPRAGRQVDKDGTPYDHLPPVIDNFSKKTPETDSRFPTTLANRYFFADRYVPFEQMSGDMVHQFYTEQLQINGGKMDKFVAYSDAGSLVMGVYDGTKLPLYKLARQYTLADNFFHAAFGGSFINHMWLVCACTPTFPDAPADMITGFDADGKLVKERPITPDFLAVNTMQPMAKPYLAKASDPARRLPPQTMDTIGDRLSEKGVSWAWYAGNFNKALSGEVGDEGFKYHHQPFVYFARYGEGTPGRTEHLKDAEDLFDGIKKGALPTVTFYKPAAQLNQHPGYANIIDGDKHAADLIEKIRKSPLWKDTLIIVTYDENGGTWDHVAPPVIDRFGPGTRIPTLIISPFAKRHFVDHTMYDTTSILRFIERRFALAPLGTRDAHANDLTNALQF